MGGSRQSSHTGICSKTLLTSFKCLWWAQHFLLIHWPAWWTCYWCEPVSYLTSANKLGRVLGGQMVSDAGLHRPDSCNRVQSRRLTSKIACKITNITCGCYHYWNTAQVHMITYTYRNTQLRHEEVCKVLLLQIVSQMRLINESNSQWTVHLLATLQFNVCHREQKLTKFPRVRNMNTAVCKNGRSTIWW